MLIWAGKRRQRINPTAAEQSGRFFRVPVADFLPRGFGLDTLILGIIIPWILNLERADCAWAVVMRQRFQRQLLEIQWCVLQSVAPAKTGNGNDDGPASGSERDLSSGKRYIGQLSAAKMTMIRHTPVMLTGERRYFLPADDKTLNDRSKRLGEALESLKSVYLGVK